MSDDLPGFQDDPQPKKRTKPDDAASAGFNPFADVSVESNPLGLAKTPAAKPEGKTAKPAGKPAEPAPAPGFDAFADGGGGVDPAAAAAAEAEIRPGQGKDLWACPHCGAKNKPERTSCRACGKSPSEPVIIPFHRTPLGRIGIPTGVALSVLLLGWLLFGGSVQLVTAGPGKVDSAVRRGGSAGAQDEVGGMIFQPGRRIAVSGRVLAIQPMGALTAIVLALGKDARDDDAVQQVGVDFGHNPPRLTPELRSVTLYAFGNVPTAAKGDWLSVLGDGGRLIRDGVYASDYQGGEVIRITQSSP